MANDTRRFHIKVDAEGFLIGLFDTVYGEPTGEQIAGFTEVNQADYAEISEYQGLRRFVNGKVVEYTPPPPPVQIPQVVSRFQARAALYGAGLLDDVETAIAAADPITQMAWADAQEFQRNSPTILTLAVVLGLSESDVDELFIAASGIVA